MWPGGMVFTKSAVCNLHFANFHFPFVVTHLQTLSIFKLAAIMNRISFVAHLVGSTVKVVIVGGRARHLLEALLLRV